MKKITATVIALLIAFGFIFGVASCQKNEYDFSAELKESEVVIYNGKKVFQTEKYPEEKLKELDFDYAKEHISFVDVNFDGYKDLCVAVNRNGETVRYMFWVFDSKTKLFVYSEELSKLTTVAVNADKKQLVSSVLSDGKLYYETYTFENGKLTLLSKIASDSPDVPDDVSQAVKNNTLGENGSFGQTSQNESTSKQNGAVETEKQNAQNKETTASSGNNRDTQKTTSADSGDVQLATGDIDDGWF